MRQPVELTRPIQTEFQRGGRCTHLCLELATPNRGVLPSPPDEQGLSLIPA